MTAVVVTGLGVVSPLGCSARELARRVAAGERAGAIEQIPLELVPAERRARIGRLDRLCRLFLAASYLAVDDARLTIGAPDAARVGLSFGTGLGCLLSDAEFYEKVVAQGPAGASPRVFAYTVSSAAAGEVSMALGIHGPNVTAHHGLAAGAGAFGYGVDLIRMGKADVVLAGAADASGAALLDALRAMRLLKTAQQARPFVDAVPGVWPSEGAVVAVLERREHAQQRGATVLARLEGHAAGCEPTLTGRAPSTDGLVAVLQRALADSRRAPAGIATVLASAHGTPLDAVEAAALRAVFGTPGPTIVAPKAELGESFAAGAGLALALAVAAPELQPALISSICYSGPVAALVVS